MRQVFPGYPLYCGNRPSDSVEEQSMSGTVTCNRCGGEFQPLESDQADLVRRCAAADFKEQGIKCPLCKHYTMVDPVAVVAGRDGTISATPTYRCPVSQCAGWVSYVNKKGKDKPFWGCGECGSIWYDQARLLGEIEQIIKRFPYRKKCYRKSKGQWAPADPDRIPDNYEERVGDEPEDDGDDYVRG
jgi:transcription elongation factor Elf1